MFPFFERFFIAGSINRTVRHLGSVTAPQLMRLVNDLDTRVYRTHLTNSSKSYETEAQVDDFNVSLAEKLSSNKVSAFGDLASRCKLADDQSESAFATDNQIDDSIEEKTKDHHLRLSETGRKHEPSWYLGRIYRLCKAGNSKAAMNMFFHQMLTVDRVLPDRNIVHVLLSGLAEVGDSEAAFKVYSKMTELGIPVTNSTLSRIFKACSEDICVWQREHRYTLQLPSNSQISSESDLKNFAGPALDRARGLWLRLHERGFRMNRITYNTLLLALAKGGDLNACFQALDAMLLGRGGLPPSIIAAKPPQKTTRLTPFRPDEYTLTAVLTAVQQSYKSGVIASPIEALRLALHVWHLITPRLPNRRPSLHNFTLMAGILGLSATRSQKRFSLPASAGLQNQKKRNSRNTLSNDVIQVIPESLPRLGITPPPPQTNQRLLSSKKAASDLLRQVALLASGQEPATLQSQPDTTCIALSTRQDGDSVVHTLTETGLTPINWTDSGLTMHSPVNLLLPLPPEGVRIPLAPKDTYPSHFHSCMPPWQRLGLCGGLVGFLDCIQSHFKVSGPPSPQIFTKLASLLPPADGFAGGAALDQWETAFLSSLEKYKVALDLPVFNSLLQRRTLQGLPTSELMGVANRQGLSPDEFTWACLARSCRTSREVRDFLNDYSKAASTTAAHPHGEPCPRGNTVRPSLHVYATLLSATTYYWDAKIVVIRSMAGNSQLTSKRLKQETTTAMLPNDAVIPPNRRILANLEFEIANYRDLVARGVVPKDGSSIGGCEATAGLCIPAFSLGSFRKFLPIYKAWAEKTSVVVDGP